ncbi:head maturation protease, ClpP-related [uncultured Sunxiuqinia sp.]|uniref:head maturation protease, ClpP-related n=1 Tax=uncultured Sunxiuqinia sp. TaxID=1573825 RepID=UPI00260FF7E9|nr:head maturation protease, ClpP-related [uncultured Sunxiuqinia sp.]
MPKQYYSVENKKSDSVDILIYGVIGDSWFEESVTARQFVADLKALEKDYSRINIRINSPGGSVFDGLPIFNAISNSTADIHTYNDGLCASMAAVILLAGKVVHSADNALMMLHSPISGVYGNAGDFEQVLEMLGKVQDSLITCITSRNTSKTAEEIEAAYFDHKDHWLTADEALEELFIDEIVKGSKKISNRVKNMSHEQVIDQFDKLVKGRSLFDRFFSQAHDFFNPNQEVDMNLKTLTKACGLPDDATEQDVLDWINEHGAPGADDLSEEEAEEEEAEEAEESEEEAEQEETEEDDSKDQEIADLKAQLEALKKGPGAKNKKVPKKTDSGAKTEDTFKTYSSAKSTWDAVNDLFE